MAMMIAASSARLDLFVLSSLGRRPGAQLIVLVTWRHHHGAADRLFVVVRHRRADAMDGGRRRGGERFNRN